MRFSGSKDCERVPQSKVSKLEQKTETKRKTEPEAKHVRLTAEQITVVCACLYSVSECVTWGQASERHHQPPRPGIVQALCELPCWFLFLTVYLNRQGNKTNMLKSVRHEHLATGSKACWSKVYKYPWTYSAIYASSMIFTVDSIKQFPVRQVIPGYKNYVQQSMQITFKFSELSFPEARHQTTSIKPWGKIICVNMWKRWQRDAGHKPPTLFYISIHSDSFSVQLDSYIEHERCVLDLSLGLQQLVESGMKLKAPQQGSLNLFFIKLNFYNKRQC